MLFRLLMVALAVLMLSTIVFEKLFWWFMIATGVVMCVGVVVEVFWNWRQERALSPQREEKTPSEALAVTAASKAAEGKE